MRAGGEGEYWSFSISSSNEYSGLIAFRIDWFDLLAAQGTLKSLLQHPSSKISILQCPAFFITQPLYPYMTTGHTIALTICTFVSKVMSLLFNMLGLASFVAQLVNNSSAMRWSWIQFPRLGSSPGEGKGYRLQYSGLESSMDCIVYGIAKSQA